MQDEATHITGAAKGIGREIARVSSAEHATLELAYLDLDLAAHESRRVTGTAFAIDGGWTAQWPPTCAS
jgi:hypothetical protein